MGYWSVLSRLGPDRRFAGAAEMKARTFSMTRKAPKLRWLVAMVLLVLAEGAFVAAIELSMAGPAMAQRDDRYSGRQRRSSGGGGGFFQQLFGGRPPVYEERDIGRDRYREREPAAVDSSHAPPPPRRADKTDQVEPTTSIVVMGDGMADWLAFGLDEAFADSPEVAIVRESKARSGLLRYDSKNDVDWWNAAREILAKQKANYVVMMLGVSDRQNIRERDIEKEAEKREAEKKEAEKKAADAGKGGTPVEAAKEGAKEAAKETDNPTDKEADKDDEKSIVAPEPKQTRRSNGVVEFRSDQWEKVYSRRIDQTIAALKSKGVPVFWVGLPSIRGAKSTADAVYLNDLFRARAERAGVVYIDVWDGFVDEAGKYANYGPDYEGQTRRLRSADGVFFTKYGARKVAHYVEREIRRYMSNRGSLALPTVPTGPLPADGKPAARPLAGPVVPLTMNTSNTDTLLGGRAAPQAARADAIATGVLVKGDPVMAPVGRADDFVWPRGSDTARAAASARAPEPAKPAGVKPAEAKPVEAKPAIKPEAKLESPAAEPVEKPAVKPVPANTKPPRQTEQRPHREAPPRPPQPVRQRSSERSGGIFGLFR